MDLIDTQHDIARSNVRRAADLSRVHISDVLSRDPLVFDQNETIDGAIRHLRARNTRYALVIGSGGAYCGLISLDGLLSEIAPSRMPSRA